MKNLLNIITIILCVWLSWGRADGARKRESGKVSFHRIEVSSLFQSSSGPCVPSPRAFNTKSSLQVVHRYGPCSSLSSEKAKRSPDHSEILRLDQARVKSIHSKLSKKRRAEYRVMQSQSTDLQVRDGSIIGSGNYIVTVGIGTPKHDLSLVFNTASDLTWTQCEPCGGSGTCYPQEEPIFDPSSSSSYSNVSCSSPLCDSITSQGFSRNCSTSNCVYGESRSISSISGFLAKEKFTLNTDVFDNINFGCGENNHGHFIGAAGILGLSRGPLSFASQTAMTYDNIFSYCLPSSPEYGGSLTFGSGGLSDSVKYTPISTVRNGSYGLDITGITVAGEELEINSSVFSTAGAIIESATVITYLPPKAYAALRTAFKKHMLNYTATMGDAVLDTCYDFTGVAKVQIPAIFITFKGGAVVDVGIKGTLFELDTSRYCLAFAGNDNDDDLAFFGTHQQRTLQVVYDRAGGRVGFAPDGCL